MHTEDASVLTDSRASIDKTVDSALFGYVYPNGIISQPIRIDAGTIMTLPAQSQLCKRGDYITNLVKRFEGASHDGPASTALEAGRGILAIYTLIYPPIYPLTGRFLDPMEMFAHDYLVHSLCTVGARKSLLECRGQR